MTQSQLCLICSSIYGATGTSTGIILGALWTAASLGCWFFESRQRKGAKSD